MPLKRLIARLIAAVIGFILATTAYEAVIYVVLRPLTNKLVEDQLTNSNSTPTAMNAYFTLANGIFALCCVALLAFCVISVVKYRKGKE